MKATVKKILQEIDWEIRSFRPSLEFINVGKVIQVLDGVVKIEGLEKAMLGEILEFPQKTQGLAVNLEKETVGAIILGPWTHLKEGDEVRLTGRILEIGSGEELLGRVIDPLGNPLDGKPKPKFKKAISLEKIAPSVIFRQSVDTPLETGVKVIDALIPIGRGQRELIIGDRGTGKTAFCLDTIINQKDKGVVSVYVAIGQKQAKIVQVVAKLQEFGALAHTVVVVAGAAQPVALQYLAPYAGCAIGEYFLENGKDALVVYDDLTKHAWAWRQISLILKRPSGREAYPGDIFYLHSRLLERACRLAKKYGGGSLTALPLVETQANDISAYIPTNVISITDGQIYLEPDLFHAGVRPAVNVGLSVSRVGGAAQTRAMKQVAGRLRLEMATYRELAAFAQFGTELDKATQEKLERGARITEILKQPQYRPYPLADQVLILWAVTSGYLDDLAVGDCQEFEEKFLEFVKDFYPQLQKVIAEEKELTEGTLEKMKKVIEEFKKSRWPV